MIQDVDETLRGLLASELQKFPGSPIQSSEQIVFGPPGEVKKGVAQINLFLHNVCENTALREEPFRYARKPDSVIAERRRPPVRLNLAYLVTAHAADNATEHRLLIETLGALLRFPTIPIEYRKGALQRDEASSLFMTVAQPENAAHSDAAQLWQAIGGPMRPALGLVVTAPYDPFEAVPNRVVLEAIIGTGQGVPPDGPQQPLDRFGTRVSAAGVVWDRQQNKPLEGVLLHLKDRDESARSDKRGFFYFLNLPEGPQVLTAERRGYQSREIAVVVPPPGRSDLLTQTDVPLEPMAEDERVAAEAEHAAAVRNAPGLLELDRRIHVSLTGRLRFASGKPAAHIPVRVGRQRTQTDSEGVYHFYDLPAGDAQVFADLPGQGEVVVPRAGREDGEDSPLLPAAECGEAAQNFVEKGAGKKQTATGRRGK